MDIHAAIETDIEKMVERPSHYQLCGGKVEAREILDEVADRFHGAMAANIWNAGKYFLRLGRKDNTLQDLKKMRKYVDFAIQILEKQ